MLQLLLGLRGGGQLLRRAPSRSHRHSPSGICSGCVVLLRMRLLWLLLRQLLRCLLLTCRPPTRPQSHVCLLLRLIKLRLIRHLRVGPLVQGRLRIWRRDAGLRPTLQLGGCDRRLGPPHANLLRSRRPPGLPAM